MSENKLPAVTQKNIADNVLARVNEFQSTGELTIPQDYSPENALKSAWLILQQTKTKEGKPVLEVCTKDSIANALLDMVVQGLSPMKKQGDFITYGTTLVWQREYTGNIALAKRFGNLDKIHANVVYDKDDFVYTVVPETGVKKLVKHDQKMENIDNSKIRGAYAVCIYKDGSTTLEIMNIDMIKKAWQQGAAKGTSGAHTNFTDQMCIKTVINRATKLIFRESSDVAIIADRDEQDRVIENSQSEIANNANQETIDTPVTVVESNQPEQEEQQQSQPEIKF